MGGSGETLCQILFFFLGDGVGLCGGGMYTGIFTNITKSKILEQCEMIVCLDGVVRDVA